jgi:S1-C subfamily serine protease
MSVVPMNQSGQSIGSRWLGRVMVFLVLMSVQPVLADQPDGTLPREVLDRVKSATVYIRVINAEGRKSSGSGFFEESSHKVLTNAHVLDMLVTDSKPPRQIEVIRNSGRPGEVTWKATILAVDQESDLAVLKIEAPPAEESAIPGLKVNPAKNLAETQRVFVFGYPFGEQLNKNVTVSTSSVSSLVLKADGQLKRVQVNGGIHPGNSGGPVIDGMGNVVGVAVSGVEGTQINFAIPGEHVTTLLNGRYTGASWKLEASQRDGKFYVPVTFNVIDPLGRISKFEVEYWVGKPNLKFPASDKQLVLPPDVGPRRTLPVNYSKQRGMVELEFTQLPAPDKVVYFQAVVTNGTGKPFWYGPTVTYVLAPVEARPCTIVYKPRLGLSPTFVQSSQDFRIAEDGQEDNLQIRLEALFNENTVAEGLGTHATLGVKRLTTVTRLNNEPAKITDEFRKAVTMDVLKLNVDLIADSQGGLVSKKNDLTRITDAQSKKILNHLGEQLQQSLETGYIPLPSGELKPGQTIQATRQLPIDLPKSKQSAGIIVTYTYRGVRLHNGKPMAVFGMTGKLDNKTGSVITYTGKMTGNAMVDLETGVVIRAHTNTQATVVLRSGGDKFQAKGTLDTNITRGSEVVP